MVEACGCIVWWWEEENRTFGALGFVCCCFFFIKYEYKVLSGLCQWVEVFQAYILKGFQIFFI